MLNEQPDVLCERSYAVWPDLEAIMRERGIPAFTVDAHRPIADFDILGVSFATELGYTNMYTAIDLAGMDLHASKREAGPLVIAGGHAAFNRNPSPISSMLRCSATVSKQCWPSPTWSGAQGCGSPRRA